MATAGHLQAMQPIVKSGDVPPVNACLCNLLNLRTVGATEANTQGVYMYTYLLIVFLQTPERSESSMGMQARLGLLSNITVEYEISRSDTPEEWATSFVASQNTTTTNDSNKSQLSIVSGHKTGVGVFRLSNAYSRFDLEFDTGEARTQAYTEGRYETLFTEKLQGPSKRKGIIRNEQAERLPPDGTIDYALGLRLLNAKTWITADAIGAATIGTDGESGHLKVHLNDNQYPAIKHLWTVDPAHSYRLLKYEIFETESNTDAAEYAFAEIENTDFLTVDGLELPQHISYRQRYKKNDGAFHQTSETIVQVKKYTIGDKSNTSESMRIIWPTGTAVVDYRTGTLMEVVDNPHALSDINLTERKSSN